MKHVGLRSCIAMLLISSVVTAGNAETYTLDYETLSTIFPIPVTKIDESAQATLTDEGTNWNIVLGIDNYGYDGSLESVVMPSQSFVSTTYRFNGMTESNNLTHVELSTDFFADKIVKNVSFNVNAYRSTGKTTTYEVTVGEQTASATYVPTSLIPNEKVDVAFENDATGDMTIKLYWEGGNGRMYFRSITVEYEIVANTTKVQRRATIPVGHKIELEADADDATIFYTTDGSEDWQTYSPAKGIAFPTPGLYSLKYYATTAENDVASAITTEDIDVVDHTGFAAAIAANNEIEVSGRLVSRETGYILIADPDDDNVRLAIDTTNYPALQNATIGAEVVASGRPTDRFGANIKGLGSISQVIVDGTVLRPTSATSIKMADRKEDKYYDMQGRSALPYASSRRILISDKGGKVIR